MNNKNAKKRNISATALDNDKLEDVSGGYQIITATKDLGNEVTKVKRIIKLSGDEQNWLKANGYSLNDSTNYYDGIKGPDGKNIGIDGIISVLEANGFSGHSG